MDELNETVLTAVQESPLDDYGQRSALGMARSWIDNHKAIERETNSLDTYVARDNLAIELVGILAGHDRHDQMEALANARAVVNAPFLDPSMNGQRFKNPLLKGGREQ